MDNNSITDFDKLKLFMLSWEGGFVNDPRDPGGATNKGVTLATFRIAFGKERTVQELKNITDNQWSYIFREFYWNKWKADDIKDSNLKYLLVDWVWTSGKYGITKVQEYLKTTVDGVVGPKTIEALNKLDGKKAFGDIWKIREKFIKSLKNYKIYGKGWMRRLDSILYNKLINNK